MDEIPYLVIAANNNEDIRWSDELGVYKITQYHPLGREAYSYLWWLSNAEPMSEIVFCQGNPFAHDPDFLEHIKDPSIRYYGELHECDKNSKPSYDAPIHSWCDVLGLPKPDLWKFVAGSQYRVSPEQINIRTHQFYKALLKLTFVNDKSPWILERLWPLIWNINL